MVNINLDSLRVDLPEEEDGPFAGDDEFADDEIGIDIEDEEYEEDFEDDFDADSDFDVDTAFSDEVLVQIEKKMKELAKSSQEIFRSEISAKDAVTLFKNMDEDYKVEIIEQINPDDVISTYKQSDFVDYAEGLMYQIPPK